MRFVPTINPPAATPTSRAVKGLSATYAVKPIHEEVEPTVVTLSSEAHERENAEQQLPEEERRKACRRIQNQKVPLELRSEHDRRRQNQLDERMTDHIDEEA